MTRVLKRVVILGVSFVSLAGFLAWQNRSSTPKPSTEATSSPNVDLSLRCRSSLLERYSFRYTSESRFSRQIIGMPTGASQETLDVSLRGDWSERCALLTSDLRTLSFDVSRVDGHVRGSSPGFDSTEEPSKLLSGRVFSTVSVHGEVNQIYFPQKMEVLGQHLLRDLLSLRSFRLPPNASIGETWKRAENDLLGVYNAEYRLISAHDGVAKVKKRRLGYEGSGPDGAGMTAGIGPDNEMMISIDLRSGRIRDVETSIEVTQSLDGKVVGVNKTRLSLSYVGSETLSSEEIAMQERDALGIRDAGQWVLSDTRASDVEHRLERRLHEQQLAGRSWDDVREQIVENGEFDTDTFLSAKALLVLQPKLADRFRDLMMSDKDPNGTTFQLTAGALAAAGTPQAQAAMLESVSQLDSSPTGQNILLGLMSQVEAPTEETVRVLERMSQDEDMGNGVANSAQLALGSVARQLDPPDRAPIVDDMLSKLRHSQSLDQKVNALLSLGNTGAPRLRSEFLAGLKDSAPLVRKASCFALGQQSQGDVAEPLLHSARNDDEAQVRVECLDALGTKKLAIQQVDAVLDIALHDRALEVRLAALRIAGNYPDFPGLGSVLAKIREEDSSPEVRRAAALVLLRIEASS